MNLPLKCSYTPRYSLILYIFGAGLAWMLTLLFLDSWHFNLHPAYWLGFLLIAGGFLLILRRAAFEIFLALEIEDFVVPTGFLRLRMKRVPYSRIEAVWMTRLPLTAILHIATDMGKFEVVSTMLADDGKFIVVANFLNARSQENQRSLSAGLFPEGESPKSD